MNTDLQQNLLSQPNSSLLPMHEFEKINENFRKFKDKKKNLKDSQEIHDPKSRQKKNLLTVRSSNNSKFGDATSEITVNASIDVAAERSIQNNMSKISVDCIPGNAETSNFSQSWINYKNNLEDRSQDIKESENVEEDEVNIISIDEESSNGIKGKTSPSQSKKFGKYRRNRNMRQVKLTLN